MSADHHLTVYTKLHWESGKLKRGKRRGKVGGGGRSKARRWRGERESRPSRCVGGGGGLVEEGCRGGSKATGQVKLS